MKLPIKTRILDWAITKDGPFTAKEMADELCEEYNHERTTTVRNIEKQIDTYCRVGFIEATNADFDDHDELVVTYNITEAGKKESKYLPGHGNKLF